MSKNKFLVTPIGTEKQFFSIGEVSKITNEDQHVLRFWEKKFPIISPVRKSGNRRYYRTEDINVILKIQELIREKGVTIKGLQKLLKNKTKHSLLQGDAGVVNIFAEQTSEPATEDQTSGAPLVLPTKTLAELTNELSEINHQIMSILSKYKTVKDQ